MTDELHRPGYCWCGGCRARWSNTPAPACQVEHVAKDAPVALFRNVGGISQQDVTDFVQATREKLELYVEHAPSNHFKQILQDWLRRTVRVEKNLTPRDVAGEGSL